MTTRREPDKPDSGGLGRTGGTTAAGPDDAPTSPLPLPSSGGYSRDTGPARRGRGGLIALGAVALIAVTSLATTAYVLTVRSHLDPVPAGAASSLPTSAAAPTITTPATATTAASAADAGPVLLEADGNPVDADTAEQIRDVYRALADNDLGSIRVAFGAAGSDDGTTSEPHLRDGSVRARLLAALRTPPTHPDATSYRYARAGYSLTFSAAIDGYTLAGLDEIAGPWTTGLGATATPAPATASSSPSCAAGTRPVPTDGYPCTDIASGVGVNTDGTSGVHGLKPCPPDAVRPSDPDLPARNPHTGAVCGGL